MWESLGNMQGVSPFLPSPDRCFQPIRLRALVTHRRVLQSPSPLCPSPLPPSTSPDRLHSHTPHFRRRTGSAFKLTKPVLTSTRERVPVRIRSITPIRIPLREMEGLRDILMTGNSRKEGKVMRPKLREMGKGEESEEMSPWQGSGLYQ